MRELAENPEHAVLGAIEDLDDAAGMADVLVAAANFFDAQEHAVADARGFARLGLRGTTMRIFGGGPCSCSSHSAGTAINSPSESRPVTSASVTGGNAPG